MRKTTAITAITLATVGVGISPAFATPGDDHKTFFCHATGSHSNPYVKVNVDKASAHKDHADDLFDGPIVANNCLAPIDVYFPPTATPTPSATPSCVSWNNHSCEPGNPGPTTPPTIVPTPTPTTTSVPVTVPSVMPTAEPTHDVPPAVITPSPVQTEEVAPQIVPVPASTVVPVENPEEAKQATGSYTQLANTASGNPWGEFAGWAVVGAIFTGIGLMIFGRNAKR